MPVPMHVDDEEPTKESPTRVPTCITVCWMRFILHVWPTLRKALTFTVSKEGVFGNVLNLLGCLMAYFSAFTISYQVYKIC